VEHDRQYAKHVRIKVAYRAPLRGAFSRRFDLSLSVIDSISILLIAPIKLLSGRRLLKLTF